MKAAENPFRPRARLLLQLGDELLKNESIALFELVKNAYDADATRVSVSLEKIDSITDGSIVISDDGCGMTWDTVTKIWMEPGTDYRERQIQSGYRTPKFKRHPMGQKGIGRFGAHKLGKKIELITRAKGENEVVVKISWEEFRKNTYLNDIPVKVTERTPIVFKGEATGTILKITGLWKSWNRGLVRAVYRGVNSICSPFKDDGSFKTELILKDADKKNWLGNLLTWKEALELKLFKATCLIRGDELSYNYEFTPWKTMTRVEKRKTNRKNITLRDSIDKKQVQLNLNKYGIGDVRIDLYIYDLDSNVLALGVEDKRGLKEFLHFNGGIRVYRDGIRVYNYGEPGDDWLELGTRRVNIPVKRLSNNIVIGAVSINRKDSNDLIEKTNREGFIENEALSKFKTALLLALVHVESERNIDKERLRRAYSKTIHNESIIDDLSELKQKMEKRGVYEEYKSYIERIDSDYKDLKEKLLSSAGAGLSLSIVIHEIEKIIAELKLAVEKEHGGTRIKTLVQHLAKIIDGYSGLIRREGNLKIKAGDIVKQAIFNVEYRLNAHKIELVNGCTNKNDFSLNCTKRLVLGAIMNVLDNSIWWLENKKPYRKMIFITTTNELTEGPAIIIADNGPGFLDPIEYVTQPFFTRKPDGMGLGLHITNEIMKAHGGKILILGKGDVELPRGIDGAIVALVFGGTDHD